jgi:hypothetical protein
MLDNRSQWMQVGFPQQPTRSRWITGLTVSLCVCYCNFMSRQKFTRFLPGVDLFTPKQNILARLILKWQYFVSNHKTTCMLAIARPLPVPDLRHKTRSPSGKRNRPKTKEHEAVVICIVYAAVTSIIIRSLLTWEAKGQVVKQTCRQLCKHGRVPFTGMCAASRQRPSSVPKSNLPRISFASRTVQCIGTVPE